MGRSTRNVSERCRSSLWAKRAWLDSGLSFDRLDLLLLDGLPWEQVLTRGRAVGSCRRVFNRIYRRGDRVDGINLTSGGPVHLATWAAERYPVFEAAREDYFCPLWELLAGKAMPDRGTIEAVLDSAMDRLGVVQMTPEGIAIGLQLCGSSFPVQPGDDDLVTRGAELVANQHSLDGILALALQCRLAAESAQYRHAQIYLDALEPAVESFGQSIEEPHLGRLLMELIDRRLLQNNWTPSKPHDWPHAYLHETGDTEVDRERWHTESLVARRNGNLSRASTRDMSPTIPMVIPDAKLSWFMRNGTQLIAAMLAEKADGHQELLPMTIPHGWQDLLHTARHLFGEPVNTETIYQIAVSGAPSSDAIETSAPVKRKSLKRKKA